MTGPHVLHPFERLTTPDGESVEIDVEMVPLIRQLWRLGLATVGCCQDLGESIVIGNSASRRRHADFHTGRAWLQMPLADAQRLLGIVGQRPEYQERLVRWTHPDAWSAFVYLEPADGTAQLAPTAQIHFPRRHVPALTELLRSIQPARDRADGGLSADEVLRLTRDDGE